MSKSSGKKTLLLLPATPTERQTIAERQWHDRAGIIKPSRLQGQTLASDYPTRNVGGRRERALGIDLGEPREVERRPLAAVGHRWIRHTERLAVTNEPRAGRAIGRI
jgi:hypothetical protein